MQQLDLLRLSLSLVLVILLIFAAAWLARRSGLLRNRGQATTIEIIASQSLGGRNSIVVVEVEKKRLVLGITQHQINLLHSLPEPHAFESTLQHAMQPKTPTEPTESSENHAS